MEVGGAQGYARFIVVSVGVALVLVVVGTTLVIVVLAVLVVVIVGILALMALMAIAIVILATLRMGRHGGDELGVGCKSCRQVSTGMLVWPGAGRT